MQINPLDFSIKLIQKKSPYLILFGSYTERDDFIENTRKKAEQIFDFETDVFSFDYKLDDDERNKWILNFINILSNFNNKQNFVLYIKNLENLKKELLIVLNTNRDKLKVNFSLIFFLPHTHYKDFQEICPDLYRWMETSTYEIDSIDPTKLTKEDIEKELSKYEEKYNMTSEEFYQKWKKDELDDSVSDFNSWAIVYNAFKNNKEFQNK